jgi:pilus assembly protein Flp/PilA
MQEFMSTFWEDEAGQDLAEYALLIALVVLVVIVAVTAMGQQISSFFEQAADRIKTETG